MLKKTEDGIIDCLKGTFAALLATLVFSLLQYIGTHIPSIYEHLSQLVTAIGTIKVTRK